MSKLPADRATTLKDAYLACDTGPLKGKDLERYYVDLSDVRSKEAMENVKTQVDFLPAGEFGTLLFTGHRGCGKSTELRKLQKSWEQDYFVIYREVDVEIDIQDAAYTDLYLLIIKEVADAMARLRLRFDADLMDQFQVWFMQITEETEETIERSTSIGAEAAAGFEIPLISKLMTKLLAQIKGATKFKKTVRDSLERDVGKLKQDLNNLLRDGNQKLTDKFKAEDRHQKGFLIILDNLDRVPPVVGDRLFFDNGTHLQNLACTVIYTVPISAVYSAKNLTNTFQSPNIMPMVNIYRLGEGAVGQAAGPEDGAGQPWALPYDRERVKRLAGLVVWRMDVRSVFQSPDLVLELARASGGHVRQLMQMTQTVCLTAASRGHAQVNGEDVLYAIKQEQFNFERVIPHAHYPILAEVCLQRRMEQNVDGQIMFFNTSVLEYNGQTRWHYVNPLVKRIAPFQEAVQALYES